MKMLKFQPCSSMPRRFLFGFKLFRNMTFRDDKWTQVKRIRKTKWRAMRSTIFYTIWLKTHSDNFQFVLINHSLFYCVDVIVLLQFIRFLGSSKWFDSHVFSRRSAQRVSSTETWLTGSRRFLHWFVLGLRFFIEDIDSCRARTFLCSGMWKWWVSQIMYLEPSEVYHSEIVIPCGLEVNIYTQWILTI